MGIDVEHGFEPEYDVIEARRRCSPRSRRRPRRPRRVLPRARPRSRRRGDRLAHRRGDPGRQPEHPARPVQRDHEEGASPRRSRSRGARREEVRRAAGAAHPRPPRRLRDQPGPVEEGAARAVGRPRAVGRGAPGRRARGARSRRSCPQEYWTVEADRRGADAAAVHASRRPSSTARRLEMTHEGQAREVVDAIERGGAAGRRRSSARSGARTRRRRSSPRSCSRRRRSKLRFAPKRTMALAQRLYEGVELGDEGAVGLITYMRTDSTRSPTTRSTEARGVHRRDATARSSCPTSRSSTRRRRARRTRTRRSARPR